MSPTSFDSEKFGCVGGAVGCIIHLGLRVVQHMYCSCCAKLLWIVVQVSNQRDSPVSATCHLSWQFLKHITCCIALSAGDWFVNHNRPWRRRWRSERGRAFPWNVFTEAGKALGWCDWWLVELENQVKPPRWCKSSLYFWTSWWICWDFLPARNAWCRNLRFPNLDQQSISWGPFRFSLQMPAGCCTGIIRILELLHWTGKTGLTRFGPYTWCCPEPEV